MYRLVAAVAALVFFSFSVSADELGDAVKKDYDDYLWPLFDHFHRNPELSLIEHDTAARMASELRAAGFEVTEGVGGTGVVAMMENGAGPLVMMRADMDGLPVQEKSGLENASRMPAATTCTSRAWLGRRGRWRHAGATGAARSCCWCSPPRSAAWVRG